MNVLSMLLEGCADVLERIDARARDLLRESNPATASELLPEHEEELELPSDGTLEERQARVLARTIAQQRYRPVDFQTALAPLLGQAAADVVVIETRLWTLTKTGGVNLTWDGGASSVEAIAGDGAVEFAVGTVSNMALGFSVNDASNAETDIEYGWQLTAGGSILVREGGGSPFSVAGPGAFAVGDVFRVERTGTTIRYYKNGSLQYTSIVPSSGPLIVDSAFNSASSSMTKIRLVDAGVPKAIAWQNIVNVTPAMALPDPREVYRFFIYRNPALPGAYFLASAQALVDDIKPSHTEGHVIESVNFLCDDPFSLTDRDLLGV